MSICISCHITYCHYIIFSFQYQRSLSFSDCSLVLGRWAARRRRRPHQLRTRGRRTILAAPSPKSSAPRMRDRTPTPDVGRLHSGRPTRAFIFALARRGTIARCLAASTLLDRHASLGEACCTSFQCASLFIFCLFSYTHAYMASFWCWQASYTVSCQQGGGSTRPYFLWFHSSIFSVFYFSFHTLLFLSRERVVRNDSLIQRLGRQRSGVV